MHLNESNYFDRPASEQYMSVSQLKRFTECEALALAELSGAYRRETTPALMVGSYVDAHFSGTLAQFVAEHPEIYTRTGTLRADYQQADEIIQYLSADPLLMMMLGGESQRIITGEIAGVPFKGKLDGLLSAEQCEAIVEAFPQMADTLLMADGAIVDLKIVRDFESLYAPGRGRVSFAEYWRYPLQLGSYQKMVKDRTGWRNVPCFVLAASKEKQPDKKLIYFPEYMLSAALAEVEPLISRFHALKQNQAGAVRCEKCAYCCQTKRVVSAVDADELDGGGL